MGGPAQPRRGRPGAVLIGKGGRVHGVTTTSSLPRAHYALIFAVTMATAVGNLGLVSVMPVIGRTLAIPDALIACTFSLSALIWAGMAPLWAHWSDRLGRKPMLMVGVGGFTFSMSGCALVVLAGLHLVMAPLVIFAIFILVRSSYGLLGSAAPTAAFAIIADRTSGDSRVQALSGMAGALSLGTIMGPAVAPIFVIGQSGLAGPPLAFAAGGLVLLLLVWVGLPADRPVRAPETVGEKVPSLWRDRGMRPLLIQGLVICSAQAINIYTLGFAVIDAQQPGRTDAQWWIGITMSLGAVSSLLAQMGFVRLARPTPRFMLWGGSAVAAAGNLLALAGGGLHALVGGFVLASFGYGLARPGFSAAASEAVEPERQGAVAGAVSSIAGASIALPPVIAVACYQYWWGAPFLMAAAGAAWVVAAQQRKA